MRTKSIVFLGIILCGFAVGQFIPINAMFGFPTSILFVAFFIPYFGMKKCLKIVLVLAFISLAINFQHDMGITYSMVTFAQETGQVTFSEVTQNMKQNMTIAEFEGNMSKVKGMWQYGVFSFITDVDPFGLALVVELISAPVIKLFWFFAAYYSLKKIRFYDKVFFEVRAN